MKRTRLIKHLVKNGCLFIREGSRHSIFFNPLIRRSSSVPRYIEVNDFLAKKICRDLGIGSP